MPVVRRITKRKENLSHKFYKTNTRVPLGSSFHKLEQDILAEWEIKRKTEDNDEFYDEQHFKKTY